MISQCGGYGLFIDISPNSPEPIYAELAAGIYHIAQTVDEELYRGSFIGDGGFGSTVVVGGQLILKLSGVRIFGDAAQDFIFSDRVKNSFRNARKTRFKLIYPDGALLKGNAVLARIAESGGNAGDGEGIYIELHFDGKPVFTEKQN